MPDGDRSPRALVDVAIEAKWTPDGSGRARLLEVLRRCEAEGLGIVVKTDEESGQTILSGRDEQHLDEVITRLQNHVAVNVGAPQVAYRETITRGVEHHYTHKKQSGGVGEFAFVKFRIEPREQQAGFVFRSTAPAGNLPERYVSAVGKGAEQVMSAGPVIGFPIIDVAFTLVDGAYHDVDSSTAAFESAARAGFKDAIERAAPTILEPVMRVEVVTPEAHVVDVIADLDVRRGQVRGIEARGLAQVVGAMVPLANMFGYANSLRAMTRGLALYSMNFDHYQPVPDAIDPDDPFRPAAAMRA